MEFELPEAKILLDENGRTQDVVLEERGVANRIIELTPNGIIDKMMEYDEYITSDHIKELRAKMYGDK